MREIREIDDFRRLALAAKTDKSAHHGYHYFYPRHLACLRDESFTMLEIGYDEGHSARFWESYFPYAKLFFMDIDKEGSFGRSNVIMGDQSDREDLERITKVVGSAKFIIDDGSHQPTHQWETFLYLFQNLLEPGGIYIIEDVECNWWNPDSNVYGYRIGHFNSVEKSTSLIKMINSEFSKESNVLCVSSIEYCQNSIIIHKQTEEERLYFQRDYRIEHKIISPC